jgi:multidrug efflux pump subunit AcrA (membrane-fusion protein)
LVVSRWASVEAGDVVAELTTPALVQIQSTLFDALNQQERTGALLLAGRAASQAIAARAVVLEQAVPAATERLLESQALATQALAVAEEADERERELARIQQGNAFSRRELLQARVVHAESRKAALTAATQRDDLTKRLADLQLEAVQARARVATHESELEILEREAEAARVSFAQHLRQLSALTAFSPEELLEVTDGRPLWQTARNVMLRSPGRGRVVELFAAGGEWLDNAQDVLQIVDPTELVFRGQVPESDLGRIPRATSVEILPSVDGLPAIDSRLSGFLPVADTIAHTIQIEARVPNPDGRLPSGLSAIARVLLRTRTNEEVLVLEDCVVQDGLEWIVFRRDPAEPSTVVRLPVELGERAGDQVEVLSGLLDGDEVVRLGIHQLKHAGLGKAPPGVHIHADGSWHADHK